MASLESPNQIDESSKLKTLSFKVPILCACEGCKKKVKRILFKVQGVDTVDVDIKQQKVTVTGDVKPEVLIKKLAKHGKEARIWPENTVSQDKNTGKDKKKEKHTDPEPSRPAAVHDGDTSGEKAVKPPMKVVAAAVAEESVKVGEGSINGGGNGKDAGKITVGGTDVEKTKSEGKKRETGSADSVGNQQKPTDNVSIEMNKSFVEKKKTKGGQKSKKTGIGGAADPSPHTGSRSSDPPIPANHSPPRYQGYQFHQPPHFTQPPPVYAVSYNTANPSSSQTASFYSQPQPYSHAYSHADSDPVGQHPYVASYPYHEMQHVPPLDRDTYPGQPLDSFEMISDENPNGCFIM